MGLSLWNSNFWNISRHWAWGRHFAYAVLFTLSPRRAVALCEKRLDVDFLMPLVHSLQRNRLDWKAPLAEALLSSHGAVLRAYGAQALVQGAFSGPRTHVVARPQNLNAALSALQAHEVSAEETAYYLAVWGAHGKQDDEAANAEIAVALVGYLEGVAPEVWTNAVELLFEHELQSRAFLAAFVEALTRHQGPSATSLLELVVQRFAHRLRLPGQADLYFHRNVDLPATLSAALALKTLASQRGTTPWDEVSAAVQVELLQKEVSPLTPFRRRTRADFADVALGWAILLDLLASSIPRGSGGTTIPPNVAARARAYLADVRLGFSEEVRAVIQQLLDSAKR